MEFIGLRRQNAILYEKSALPPNGCHPEDIGDGLAGCSALFNRYDGQPGPAFLVILRLGQKEIDRINQGIRPP